MDIIGNYCRRIKSWVKTLLATHTAIVSAHHTDHKVAQAESAQFKDVNIPIGEAYKQANIDLIKRTTTFDLFIGYEAGLDSTGNHNIFIGQEAGRITTGIYNVFIGAVSGRFNTTGKQNMFLGGQCGDRNTTGQYNTFIGSGAGHFNTVGRDNTFIGLNAGLNNIDGNYNVFIGTYTGFTNINGHRNVSVGNRAGYYETGSDKLFIDNIQRTNEADGRVKALIYGIFDAATANQLVRLNAKKVEMPALGNYINDAAAAADGIAIGGLYRNGNIVQVRIA